jgi:cation diffusion facilitator CzcD-associated flavoprotein CzcO
MNETNALIIGAGIAGLASASSLQKKGLEYIIIEKEAQAVTPWRNHYDRLHLHTDKGLSSLPYKKFDNTIPRYPSRQQVVEYLDQYQKEFNINPIFEARIVQKVIIGLRTNGVRRNVSHYGSNGNRRLFISGDGNFWKDFTPGI